MTERTWLLVVAGLVVAATLVGAIVLAVRVVRTRKLLGTLGVGGKVAFWGALAYTIFPIDVLPDPIYLDDIGVLAAALLYLGRLVRQHRAAQRQLPGQPGPQEDRTHRPVG
ncbi:YkvA family protein [Micromonospora haikouensis]|uniref:YkvA family protein n=1 Tax=Micromonospora haikouensis TaxID=686309 RepID=UPI00343EA726